ncbi:hypothetical protein FACS1894139_06020 [Planctomycetales bacterium]|nr:hypothetical protein FACS1894107_00370 [Planctomycetales bacterium]GHS96203.1 hypothetical protein FACS1894108_00420 [Planctomycetales bacterium]GHT04234.1 hypothetical protein FACS1894139_06020 [Planctomycetales bacterium]GHV23143.1 hypothetical protein AGMMS49959_15370 [Planctomycetales bacterium]
MSIGWLVVFLCVVAVGWIFYRFVAALCRKPDAAPEYNATDRVYDARRNAALDKFKEVHAAARDHRRQISKIVEADPRGAAKIVGKMMKRK